MLSTACWTRCNQHVCRKKEKKKIAHFYESSPELSATPKSKYVANRIIITTTFWTKTENRKQKLYHTQCDVGLQYFQSTAFAK